MKKSEIYTAAMLAVLREPELNLGEKLEILEGLLADRSLARWSEEQEAKKKVAKENE